jgi:hypothetical protein
MDFVVVPLGLPILNLPKTYILSNEKEGTWRQEGQESLAVSVAPAPEIWSRAR